MFAAGKDGAHWDIKAHLLADASRKVTAFEHFAS
jgi:hypothetical protein